MTGTFQNRSTSGVAFFRCLQLLTSFAPFSQRVGTFVRPGFWVYLFAKMILRSRACEVVTIGHGQIFTPPAPMDLYMQFAHFRKSRQKEGASLYLLLPLPTNEQIGLKKMISFYHGEPGTFGEHELEFGK